MKVLIACEFSGVVREAFKAQGHDAWSCDILPTEIPGQHMQGDVLQILDNGWDLMVAHPPCTYTSQAGYRWFKKDPTRIYKARQGYEFFMTLVSAPIERIAVENTRGLLWQWYREPDQIVHPYHFGDPYTKATCLWLKNLSKLWYTSQPDLFGNPQTSCNEYFVNWAKYKKGSHDGKERSITFPGIALAMAQQWSHLD